MTARLLDAARGRFVSLFGREPTAAAAAPGRVNLIGEHTDYNDGLVFPMAIDRSCVVVGGLAPAGAESAVHTLHGGPEGQTRGFDTARVTPGDLPPHDWSRYPIGVVAGFREVVAPGSLPQVRIVGASDVPLGGGLSSSASIEVAVATLLERLLDRPLPPLDKALLCQRAEHGFAGVPCGLMDQLVSVAGVERHAVMIDCRSRLTTPVPLPDPDRAVVIVANSTVRHSLASGEYAKRREACHGAAAALGVPSLRDADEGLLARRGASLNDEQRRCARHVVTENARVESFAAALRAGDLGGAGRLMAASHASLRDDFRVSCPELDTLVDAALAVPGVFGSRMTGGGFGGCTVTLCTPGAARSLDSELTRALRSRHALHPVVFEVRASAGARPLSL